MEHEDYLEEIISGDDDSESGFSGSSSTPTEEGESDNEVFWQMDPGLQESVSDLPPVPYQQGGNTTECNKEIWRGTQVDRNMRGRAPGWQSASSSFYSPSQPILLKDTDRPGHARGEFQSPLRKARKLSSDQKDKTESGICDEEGEISSSWRHRSQGRLGEKGLSLPANRGGDTWWKNPYRYTEDVPVGILYEEEGDRRVLPCSGAIKRGARKAKAPKRQPRGEKERYLNVLSDLAQGKSLDARFEEEKAAAEALISLRAPRNREESPTKLTKG